MFVAERFLSNLFEEYGKHYVSTDGGSWYPQIYQFIKLKHHLHSSFEKSIIIERTIQYVRIEPKALMSTSHAKRIIVN